MGGSGAGGILNAVASLFGAEAQKGQYEYQAGIAAMNSKIAKQNAAYQRNVGEVQAQEVGLKGQAEIGQARAVQGARGFDVAGGSNEAVRDSMHDIAVQNQRVVRANAARRAYGAMVEKSQFDAQTAALSSASGATRVAGLIGAGSSILGGATSVASKWSQGQSVGLFGQSASTKIDSSSNYAIY
jgi:hypothetical protein